MFFLFFYFGFQICSNKKTSSKEKYDVEFLLLDLPLISIKQAVFSDNEESGEDEDKNEDADEDEGEGEGEGEGEVEDEDNTSKIILLP